MDSIAMYNALKTLCTPWGDSNLRSSAVTAETMTTTPRRAPGQEHLNPILTLLLRPLKTLSKFLVR
jgi:hypothetical protein